MSIKEKMEPCSWCPSPMIVYLMGQPFCASCSQKFRDLHNDVTRGRKHGRKHNDKT